MTKNLLLSGDIHFYHFSHMYRLILCILVLIVFGSNAVAQDEQIAPISADSAEPTDAEIQTRLSGIFSEIAGLESVTVESEVGVVTLGGTVLREVLALEAERLAEAVEGVVTVQNNIRRDNRFFQQIQPVIQKLSAIGETALATLPLILLAAAIVVLFWWFGGWISSILRLPNAWAPNLFVDELVRLFVRLTVGLIGFLLAAEMLGATALLISVLGGLGVVGLALGFAIRDTVENFVASVLLSLRQPFGANEHVVIDGNEGRVVRLTSRATILLDFNGNHVRLPNSLVYKSTILNYSRNAKRRLQFDVGVDTDVEPSMAQKLAVETLNAIDGVLSEPVPQCVVHLLGDSNVVLRIYAWIDQIETDFKKTRSVCMAAVKLAFESAAINMPEPIYRLRVENVDSTAHIRATVSEDLPDRPTHSGDTKPDTAIEAQVEIERDGDDLLSNDAPRE